jgi:hypothetical protein
MWRDHSLTIVLAVAGVTMIAIAFLFEDKWWDVISGLGQGILTGGLVFFLSRFFREVSKPEDPPEGA